MEDFRLMHRSPETIIVARRFGRLANRLAMFANLIALAEDRGCRIVNPTFHSYSDCFENLAGNFYCEYPAPAHKSVFDRLPAIGTTARRLRALHHLTGVATAVLRRVPMAGIVVVDTVAGKEPGAMFEAWTGAGSTKTVLLRDWYFRAPDLVTRHAAAIRSFLRPVRHIQAESAKAVTKLRERAGLVIGVHIRQGDYKNFKGGQYFFEVATYLEWMNELANMYAPTPVAFLVCSDAALDESAFPGLAVGFGPGDAVGDLFALSNCDRLIGPVSTYTQWASFYGDTPLYVLRGVDDRPVADRFEVSDLHEIP